MVDDGDDDDGDDDDGDVDDDDGDDDDDDDDESAGGSQTSRRSLPCVERATAAARAA